MPRGEFLPWTIRYIFWWLLYLMRTTNTSWLSGATLLTEGKKTCIYGYIWDWAWLLRYNHTTIPSYQTADILILFLYNLFAYLSSKVPCVESDLGSIFGGTMLL